MVPEEDDVKTPDVKCEAEDAILLVVWNHCPDLQYPRRLTPSNFTAGLGLRPQTGLGVNTPKPTALERMN